MWKIIRHRIKIIADKLIYKLPISAILMLHKVQDDPETNVDPSITVDNFKKFVLEFKKDFTTLDQIIKKPSIKKLCLTFDDGYDDIYYTVYPFLKTYRIPFTVFVSVGDLGKEGYLTKEQLIELSADEIVDIESHCFNHQPLRGMTEEEQEYELVQSKKELELIVKKPINYLAYPFGQCDEITMKVHKKNIYKGALIASGGCANIFYDVNRYKLPRLLLNNARLEKNIEFIKKHIVKNK